MPLSTRRLPSALPPCRHVFALVDPGDTSLELHRRVTVERCRCGRERVTDGPRWIVTYRDALQGVTD